MRYALRTQYLAPARRQGARIVVTGLAGGRRTYAYAYASHDPGHTAAQAYADQYCGGALVEWLPAAMPRGITLWVYDDAS